MNTKVKVISFVVVAVLALVALGAGVAYAQTPAAQSGFGPGWMMGGNAQAGSGYGRMGGRGMMSGSAQTSWEGMNAMHQWMTTSGGMHTLVWNALAEKLGMTSDELNTALTGGKTLVQLAEEKGLTRADLVAEIESAHKDSLAQAVKDGVITQAQADTVLAQMAGRYDWMIDHMLTGTTSGGMMGRFGGAQNGGGCMGGAYNPSATAQPKP